MAGNRATLRVWLSALPVPQMSNEPLPSPALVATRGEFLLRHDWRLLNNGSFGACPRPVFAAYQRWQAAFEEHPGGFMARLDELMTGARSALASYLHTDQSRLAFVTNATMGVNVVAHSLRSHLEPGDEVLATNHEYGACNHAWQFNCARAGARYINRPIDLPVSSAEEVVQRLWAGVNARTRVVFLSHTTSPTAITLPVAEICRRAREAGILTVVDGAHVPGQRDLQLDEIDPDFYTGNCHKWMCSPKGTAFLYARPEVQKLIEPLIVGHGWLPDRRSERPLVDYVERFGTRDMAGFLAVPAAIAYMEANDWQQVRKRCHRMARDAKRTVERELQTASLCPESFAWFSQLCPIRLPDDTDVGALSEMLRDRYRIEMPLLAWQGIKLARLSVQVYTQQGEVDAAVAALLRHVPECRPGMPAATPVRRPW